MIASPYLLYLGSCTDILAVKTARGVAHWRADKCIGERRTTSDAISLGLPELTYAQAAERGARTVILGVANRGGILTDQDREEMLAALNAGLDVASGLHQRLKDQPELAAAAERNGCRLHDVRFAPTTLPVGNGERRAGHRILTVGTDCSVGKMYTSLALEAELKRRGVRCDFRATGQTGILISGEGVPVDGVISDFLSGSVEWLSPARRDGGIDIIEGQGGLFHPSYAGVSLGLLHGAQPDVIVVCDELDRPHMRGLPGRAVPGLLETIEANLEAARVTNPEVVVAGVAVNSSKLQSGDAAARRAELSRRLGLPVEDPVITGVRSITDRILECLNKSQSMASAGS